MRYVFALAFAGVLTATSALAADKGGPTVASILPPAAAVAPSCYVSALAGSSITSVKADQAVLPVSLSTQGWTITGAVGCDIKVERVVIGLYGQTNLPVDTDANLLKAEQTWEVGGRLGYLLTGNTMLYGKVGYSFADLKIATEKFDVNGLVLGGGLEVGISKNLSLTFEYTRTGSDKIGSDMLMDLKPVEHAARVGLTFRVNSLFGE